MMFDSFKDFMSEVFTCPKARDYVYVASGTYGFPQVGIGIDNVATIFETFNEGHVQRWEDFISQTPTFAQCLKYFCNKFPTEQNNFKGMDPLI